MFRWLGNLVDSNEKVIKRLEPLVDKINSREPEFQQLSDEQLQAKTSEFKARIKEGCTLDSLLPEAFAAVREAARRTIGQRHFDVQLMGGIVLHQGKIAEMRTGEGKTLVATLPLYLNSLEGKGCHLATVNDYLARRDPYWMGPVYHKLGVSVACIYPQQTPDEYAPARIFDPAFDSGDRRWPHFRPIARKEAYAADITYGTSSEFGFDYLRDNMVIDLKQTVQRPLNYAIVDEVDNLLIDEARTPLIISGRAEGNIDIYKEMRSVVARMKVKVLAHEPVTPQEKEEEEALFNQDYDYIAYEKEHSVKETQHGLEKVARAFGMRPEQLLSDQTNLNPDEAHKITTILSAFRNSMIASSLYKIDRDYVLKDGPEGREVVIVDEFTGRLMLGRRYSEGLHQAIEAKENVKVQPETRTFATITIQNYFRMYDKLAGMTGTAETEAEEFQKIYGLEVVKIPTHRPMIREDYTDAIYKDEKAKFKAVVNEIEKLHKEGRPVLVGTVSIEKSEYLSDLLKRKGIQHQVLNAKQHEKEAAIIAQAGQPGSVTIATNMAGRGVDIILGGNPDGKDTEEWKKTHDKVVESGGLHVLGTERHEARRIDNQLRGRAGRQGDPGSSHFYVSLEDDVVKRFGGDRIKGLMEWTGMDENTPIENGLVNKAIESAQVRVEGFHFDMRKHLVDYDDVVNKQRDIIYAERRKILSGADLKANILDMIKKEIQESISSHVTNIDRDIQGILNDVGAILPLAPTITADSLSNMKESEIEETLVKYVENAYEQREKEFTPENMRILERIIMLRIIDNLWVEHLTAMEEMRQQAQWQTLAQVKAVDAYKNQGFQQFQVLLSTIQHDVAHTIFHVGITRQPAQAAPAARPAAKMAAVKPAAGLVSPAPSRPAVKSSKKVGRNDPCPCGSGKKYKHCCGATDSG